MLEKKVLAAAFAPSYSIGEIMLRKIGGVDLTGRALNKTAVKIGAEMIAARDARVEAYFQQPLPRLHTQPKTPIQLARVASDGGRMQTRTEAGGKGVHDPHWRETKNALFMWMKSQVFECDPHPELPACFADRKCMKSLLTGVPTTSAHMESLVKELNARVKGTEKFWNDGLSGEAILQIRAAALCDDDCNLCIASRGRVFAPSEAFAVANAAGVGEQAGSASHDRSAVGFGAVVC